MFFNSRLSKNQASSYLLLYCNSLYPGHQPFARGFGTRAYANYAPKVWIALPESVRCAGSQVSARPLRPTSLTIAQPPPPTFLLRSISVIAYVRGHSTIRVTIWDVSDYDFTFLCSLDLVNLFGFRAFGSVIRDKSVFMGNSYQLQVNKPLHYSIIIPIVWLADHINVRSDITL